MRLTSASGLLVAESCAAMGADLAEDKARLVAPGARNGAGEELLHLHFRPAAEHSHRLAARCSVCSTQLHGQEMMSHKASPKLCRQ